MRLSLSEISRERDALRSHVRLLHQQLADNAIHTALDQRKAQQPRPMQRPASAPTSASGRAGGGAPPARLDKEKQKEIVSRLHGPAHKVDRKEILKKQEQEFKKASKIKSKTFDKKEMESSVKQMYETAMQRRKTLEAKLETEREKLYAPQVKTLSRSDIRESATRLHASGSKQPPRPATARPESVRPWLPSSRQAAERALAKTPPPPPRRPSPARPATAR